MREGVLLERQEKVMRNQSSVPSEADAIGHKASWHNALSNKYLLECRALITHGNDSCWIVTLAS
jgi:hypothetical protein